MLLEKSIRDDTPIIKGTLWFLYKQINGLTDIEYMVDLINKNRILNFNIKIWQDTKEVFLQDQNIKYIFKLMAVMNYNPISIYIWDDSKDIFQKKYISNVTDLVYKYPFSATGNKIWQDSKDKLDNEHLEFYKKMIKRYYLTEIAKEVWDHAKQYLILHDIDFIKEFISSHQKKKLALSMWQESKKILMNNDIEFIKKFLNSNEESELFDQIWKDTKDILILHHTEFLGEYLEPRWRALSIKIYEESSSKNNDKTCQVDYVQQQFEPTCSYPILNLHSEEGVTKISAVGVVSFDSDEV